VSTLGLDNLGWSGRITRGVHDFILNAKEEDLVSMGLKRNVVETVLKNRETVLRNWNDSGILSAVKGVGPETWRKIVEFCAQNQSAKIDTVVTTDIHRLIRLADALHGKTGLRKVGFPISNIEDFDPFKSAVAFKKGTVSVFVSDAPEFRLGDENFGPYKKQKIELPTAAAVLLICRNRAEVVD
jgi:DNA primase small subunit